jgi:hypothetical protein
MEEKNLKIKNALSFKLLKKTRTTQVFFFSFIFFEVNQTEDKYK